MSQLASDAKISSAMAALDMTAPLPNLDDSQVLKAILVALGNVIGGGGGTGDVIGPASSTDGAVVLWDGVTGKLIKNSAVFITGGGTVALGGFTLTVPATGTAALLGVANIFTQANTMPGIELSVGSSVTNGIVWDGATIGFKIAGSIFYAVYGAGNQMILIDSMSLSWSATGAYSGTRDTGLSRDGAGILGQRAGAQAQSSRIYGTYTDASNYERLSFITTAGAYSIKPEAAGTGTLRTLEISGLPTSAAGLASGTLWNNLGIVNVA